MLSDTLCYNIFFVRENIMEKQEMELYHIHKLGNSYDKKWRVNNTINVSPNFNSEMFKR